MNTLKLQVKDKVMVIRGRDKGKKGEVLAVLPKLNQVIVEGVNSVKRHTKPNAKTPRGGIVETVKPIDASKVMALDPSSGRPARIGYKLDQKGNKERVFKVSPFKNSKPKKEQKPSTKDAVSKNETATKKSEK